MKKPILIAAPMDEELAGLRDALGARKLGKEDERTAGLPWVGTAEVTGRPLLLAVTGDGAGRAGEGLRRLLAHQPTPPALGLTVGIAGGLDLTLAVGDVVIARSIADDGAASETAQALWEVRDASPARPGIVYSAPGLLLTRDAKRRAWDRLGRPEGAVVDVESSAHAAVARAHGLPWGAVRVVSDAADEDLPALLGDCVREDGSVDRRRVARKAVFVPASWGRLWKMKQRLDQGSELLAAAVLPLLHALARRGLGRGALSLVLALGLALATGGCSAYRSAPYPAPPSEETTDPTKTPAPRLLFFALDAVPYRTVVELTSTERPDSGEAPLFRGFSGPVPLVSSFPSTSSVAFTGLLEPFGMPPVPGYEAVHFDRDTNEIEGYGFKSYKDLPYSWRDFFTWRYGKPIPRAFATATPVRSSLKEVRWVLERFLASDEPVFHGYVAMTDGAAHLEGPDGLHRILRTLDDEITRLRRERPDVPFHAVIYSDHGIAGGPPLVNVRKAVIAALADAGFRYTKSLKEEGDAVLVPFGLVSSFEIYGRPGDGPALARAAVAAPGVELCTAPLAEANTWRREAKTWMVVGADGSEARFAREEQDGQPGWLYEGDDPLGYRPGVLAADSWQSDQDWLERSAEHRFPDALHRMARAFDLVEHPASAVCSVADGHMYGAWTGEWSARLTVGRLRWTHGALSANASLGFLLTDVPGWEAPPVLRFDEALEEFGRSEESVAPFR